MGHGQIMGEGFVGSLWFRKLRHRLIPYVFIAPNIALFTAFSFLPLIYAVYIRFHDWGLIGEPSFIGIRNYLRLKMRCSGGRWRTPCFTLPALCRPR
jgi:ABC-type sugar transport system permease subunit